MTERRDLPPPGQDEGRYDDLTHNIITVLMLLLILVGIAIDIKFNPGS